MTRKICAICVTGNPRDGKKIYSKIYEESLDDTASFAEYFLYDCTMKLIENQGEQISNDLSFLLTADDAPSPTLEDLHKRLQQPGTIKDDVKFLKGFQMKCTPYCGHIFCDFYDLLHTTLIL